MGPERKTTHLWSAVIILGSTLAYCFWQLHIKGSRVFKSLLDSIGL